MTPLNQIKCVLGCSVAFQDIHNLHTGTFAFAYNNTDGFIHILDASSGLVKAEIIQFAEPHKLHVHLEL